MLYENRNCKYLKMFTLIELLIVVAIIAILAGMLLPALNKARSKGQAIACVNNLKTAGQCARFYVDGNNEWWPHRAPDNKVWDIGTPISTVMPEKDVGFGVKDSSGSSSRFVCPTAPPADTSGSGYFTYIVNDIMVPQMYSLCVKDSKIYRPSRTSLVMDRSKDYGDAYLIRWHLSNPFDYRHSGNNVCFVDGHVQFFAGYTIPHNVSTDPGYTSNNPYSFFYYPTKTYGASNTPVKDLTCY